MKIAPTELKRLILRLKLAEAELKRSEAFHGAEAAWGDAMDQAEKDLDHADREVKVLNHLLGGQKPLRYPTEADALAREIEAAVRHHSGDGWDHFQREIQS